MFKRIAGLLAFFWVAPLWSMDLQQAFELAKTQDQAYLSALSLSNSESYNPSIAWAAVLPQFNISAATSYNHQTATPTHYNQNNYALTFTQSLIELGDWKKIAQANKQKKIADLAALWAMMDLIFRTTDAYLDILDAEDQLKYAQKNEQSLQEQYHQTEQRFQVGNIAQSDLQLMLAAYTEAQAITIQKTNEVSIKKTALATIIGKLPESLQELSSQFAPTIPAPVDENAWVHTALADSILIKQSMLRAEIQADNILIAGAEYLPHVVGTVSKTGYSNHSFAQQKVTDTAMSVAVNLNILNGGGTYSAVRKANYLHQSSLQDLEETKRDVATRVRQDYLGLVSGLSQIKAFAQSVSSAEASLKAAQAAYQAGTYTIVAVLQEQARLLSSEQQYALARYEFIRNWLRLKLEAGVLAESDVATLNKFLSTSD